MDVKKILITFIIGIIIGASVVAGAGYHFIIRPDRHALAESRREAIEYRDRAFDSERRLAESISIIESGEGRLAKTIGSIREAIETIREIRSILSSVKEVLKD